MARDILYYLSTPERTLRAAAVLLGGMVYETTLALLPSWLRGTRLYRAVIAGLLRITIEYVGGAAGILPQDEITAQQFAMRKAAGTGLELLGLLTIGWSPLWIFAVAADVTGGARTYLKTLEFELKRSGILAEQAEVDSTQELLNMFEDTSGLMAEAIDIPPLTLQEMRQSWDLLYSNARRLPEPDRLARIYQDFKLVASQQDTSLGNLSALIAASAVKSGFQMGQVHIFDFYRSSLKEIQQEGLKFYTLRASRPYTAAAKSHFDPARSTYTQRLIQRRKNSQEL